MCSKSKQILKKNLYWSNIVQMETSGRTLGQYWKMKEKASNLLKSNKVVCSTAPTSNEVKNQSKIQTLSKIGIKFIFEKWSLGKVLSQLLFSSIRYWVFLLALVCITFTWDPNYTPGWIFWTMIFYNLKKFTSKSI